MYALPTLALLLPLVSPSSPPGTAAEPRPIAAADDDCAKSVVEIDIDVETGLVHAFDGTRWTTLAGDLVVYTGGLEEVTLDIHYSTGEWIAAVSADDGRPVRLATMQGALRVGLDAGAQRVVISSTARDQGASAMLAMTPVVPDVIIRPDKDCPPPT